MELSLGTFHPLWRQTLKHYTKTVSVAIIFDTVSLEPIKLFGGGNWVEGINFGSDVNSRKWNLVVSSNLS